MFSFQMAYGTDLPYCTAFFICDNIGMYLKTHKRKKNGKENEYYSIVEKRRVANGQYVQKTVLYLGAISDSQKKTWNKSIRDIKEQWQSMFKLQYDVLLYDLTSTYFEGLCQGNPKARFGHSKDRRSDCRQVLIAMVVTPEGFPVHYEVLAGNTGEKSTLAGLMTKIEDMYGKSRRVWLMDRGIPTEQTLAMMREAGIDYLVGTPRRMLDEFQSELAEKDWQQANESVSVKYLEKDGECYVLARSKSRLAKERAMRQRKLRNYLDGLRKLQKNYRNRDRFMKRLGVLQHEAGSCRHCVNLRLPDEGQKVNDTNFMYHFDQQKYREMIYRDGTYFLRTTQTGKEAVELWQQYMLQCNVEQAFKEMKSDMAVRPIFHHKENRVDAHIFIAFISYCLQATLRQKLRSDANGLTSQAVLESLSRIQMLDVSIPTQDGRTLKIQRHTEPEMEHKLILEKLHLNLPPQAPPKIHSNQVNN